jgi:hypothetical protein
VVDDTTRRVKATPATCNKSAALATCNDKSKKLQRFYDVCLGCLLGTASLRQKKINRIAFLSFCNTICHYDLLRVSEAPQGLMRACH